MKRVSLFLLTLLLSSFALFAQGGKEIKLVVTGEAETKDMAVTQALRSAIEMSFGTFVSANTTILDDDVVKDEVATISSGNIKSFRELSCIKTQDGYSVALEAVVSVDNLISYAKSKGSSCEFAGALFGAAIQMRKLNKENEALALNHLLERLALLSKNMFSTEIVVNGEPRRMHMREYREHIRGGKSINVHSETQDYYGDWHGIPLKISYRSTQNSKSFYDCLFETLGALSLSDNEQQDYVSHNEHFYYISFVESPLNDFRKKGNKTFCLRNNPIDFINQLNIILRYIFMPISVQPNGNTSVYTIEGMLADEREYYSDQFEGDITYCMDYWWHAHNDQNVRNMGWLNCIRYNTDIYPCRLAIRSNYPQMNSSTQAKGSEDLDRYLSYLGIILKNNSCIRIRAYASDTLTEIQGLFSFPVLDQIIFELEFELPVPETDIITITGFSIVEESKYIQSKDKLSTE